MDRRPRAPRAVERPLRPGLPLRLQRSPGGLAARPGAALLRRRPAGGLQARGALGGRGRRCPAPRRPPGRRGGAPPPGRRPRPDPRPVLHREPAREGGADRAQRRAGRPGRAGGGLRGLPLHPQHPGLLPRLQPLRPHPRPRLLLSLLVRPLPGGDRRHLLPGRGLGLLSRLGGAARGAGAAVDRLRRGGRAGPRAGPPPPRRSLPRRRGARRLPHGLADDARGDALPRRRRSRRGVVLAVLGEDGPLSVEDRGGGGALRLPAGLPLLSAAGVAGGPGGGRAR